mmetsp:Transcript_27860/g.89702  ORF Transcript_27860/g.89702 Transcript_27860/m.89702 type:complete len:242 (+) Transcript_27860:394-1119(+)
MSATFAACTRATNCSLGRGRAISCQTAWYRSTRAGRGGHRHGRLSREPDSLQSSSKRASSSVPTHLVVPEMGHTAGMRQHEVSNTFQLLSPGHRPLGKVHSKGGRDVAPAEHDHGVVLGEAAKLPEAARHEPCFPARPDMPVAIVLAIAGALVVVRLAWLGTGAPAEEVQSIEVRPQIRGHLEASKLRQSALRRPLKWLVARRQPIRRPRRSLPDDEAAALQPRWRRLLASALKWPVIQRH